MFKFIKYFFLLLITVIVCLVVVFRKQIPNLLSSLLSPALIISKVASSVVGIKSTDNKTNILVLGIDQRGSDSSVSSVLTDTIMVASFDNSGKNVVLVSIPRDLWVQEMKYKINAVYSVSYHGICKTKATEEEKTECAVNVVKSIVEQVTGIPIHYYAIVGFDIFVDGINAVGGVTVDVTNSFEDFQYPIEGKENAMPESSRYEHISFSAGKQEMDGLRALKYSRSRHSTNYNESGDFNRARRQQQVITALKDKVLSSKTLSDPKKLIELYNAYKNNVKTDFNIVNLPVILDVYKNKNNNEIKKIVLSNEAYNKDMPGSGMLVAPSEEQRAADYFGQYVLVPNDKTYNEVRALVRSLVFASDK